MACSQCRFWLRDYTFASSVGYCSLKNAMTAASLSCELFRRRDEEPVAIRVLSY